MLFPRNHTFLAGPIELKSNVELHLEATATLKANPDESIYQLSAFGENRGEGMLWLYANDAENLSITGMGRFMAMVSPLWARNWRTRMN